MRQVSLVILRVSRYSRKVVEKNVSRKTKKDVAPQWPAAGARAARREIASPEASLRAFETLGPCNSVGASMCECK